MKKIVLFAAVLFLAACGSNSKNVSPAITDSTSIDSLKVDSSVIDTTIVDTLKSK